jgi:hypothetical protein
MIPVPSTATDLRRSGLTVGQGSLAERRSNVGRGALSVVGGA